MTIEEINKMKRADLNQAYSEALEKIASSATDREKALQAEIEDLKAKVSAATASGEEVAKLKEEIEQKDELIRQLNKRVSELDKKASVNKTEVEHKGVRYEVTMPAFRLPGSKEPIKASELQHLPEVIAQLIEIKSAILKEIKE